jgi:hypothetical protein
MRMRLSGPLRKIAAMGSEEVRFRLRCELHKAAHRVQWAVARPRWTREALQHALGDAGASESLFLSAARSAVDARDWPGAHRALARHLVHRATAFPLRPVALEGLASRIRARFPAAPNDSTARAERVLAGRYDILGYSGVAFGRPPQWHYDPVHDRRPPNGFWSTVPYLDPSAGDHKVIWEVNRHQHWLTLGRAYLLSGDRRYYTEFVQQLEHWLAHNPPLSGVNWASMLELAFRSLSWLWAAHMFAPAALDEQEPTAPWMVDLLVGLDRQLTHVELNLSRYFSPNTHLTGEALALYVAGMAIPELRASRRRAALGREILLREATRQIRPDGGHAELSAHYHRYSTDFYLLALQVARAAQDPVATAFEEAAGRQAHYLRVLADDDGRMPLIGDDDGGQLFPVCGRRPRDCRDTLAAAAVLLDDTALAVGGIPEEVFWLCGTTLSVEQPLLPPAGPGRIGSTPLPWSGYFVSRTAAGDHLVFDAGPHGFLNGGHAHSDALSIVASVGGHPLLVDPGTGTYTMDPALRDRFRSTAMHNTVVVNNSPQSLPLGPFHWAHTTDASLSLWRSDSGVDYVEGRHAAYAPLVHARAILAVHGRAWFIIDHFLDPLRSGGPVQTDTFWHLHPRWRIGSLHGGDIRLEHAGGATHRIASTGVLAAVRGTAHADLGWYAPAYGRVVASEALRMTLHDPAPRSTLTVVPMSGCPVGSLAITPLPLTEPVVPGWHAVAYRIRFDDADAVLLASIEQDGCPEADLSAPPSRWGTADVQAVGRVALLVSGESESTGIVVNGRHLASGGAQLNHDLAQPVLRARSEVSAVEAAVHTGNPQP